MNHPCSAFAGSSQWIRGVHLTYSHDPTIPKMLFSPCGIIVYSKQYMYMYITSYINISIYIYIGLYIGLYIYTHIALNITLSIVFRRCQDWLDPSKGHRDARQNAEGRGDRSFWSRHRGGRTLKSLCKMGISWRFYGGFMER